MTNHQHPINPTPELVRQWDAEAATSDMPTQLYIATQAANWGADQQLVQCEKYLMTHGISPQGVVEMRYALRPKPSLKEQALAMLDDCADRLDAAHESTIRRALQALRNN